MRPFRLPPMPSLPSLPALPKTAWTVVWLSLALSIAAIVVLTILPKKAPLVVFDLVTEYLEQEISRPALSAFVVEGARLSDSEGCDPSFFPGDLFSGLVQPMAGNRVAYTWRASGLAISIERQGADTGVRLKMADESECELAAETINFVVVPASEGLRLPLAGAAEIGRVFGVATVASANAGLLRSGSFQVFGRSIAPWAADVLYPITSGPIVLPAGSRLSLAGPDDIERPWFGIATYTPAGFAVSATADASQVTLYRAGLRGESERFAFGVFSDFFGDPQIGLIFFSIFLLVTVLQLVTGWVGLWRDSPSADRPAK